MVYCLSQMFPDISCVYHPTYVCVFFCALHIHPHAIGVVSLCSAPYIYHSTLSFECQAAIFCWPRPCWITSSQGQAEPICSASTCWCRRRVERGPPSATGTSCAPLDFTCLEFITQGTFWMLYFVSRDNFTSTLLSVQFFIFP